MFGVRFVGYTATSKSSAFFQEKGIDTRPMFYSYKVHKHLNFHGEDKNATIINKEVLVFPSFPDLSNLQIDYICENIITFAKQYCLS